MTVHKGLIYCSCRAVAVLLLAASLYYLAFNFEWREAISLLKRADRLLLLGGGALATILFCALRALRWSLMLRGHGLRVPYMRVLHVTTVSLGFSVVTPLQSGELLKVEWLTRNGMLDRRRGYGTFAVEKVMDLAVALLIGIAGLSLFPWQLPHVAWWVPALLAGGVGLAHVLWKSLSPQWRKAALAMLAGAGTGWQMTRFLLLTVCIWGALALGWYCSLASIGVDLSAWQAFVLLAWVALIGIASMIPGSVGIAEVSVAGILAGWGVDLVSAHAAALAMRLFSVILLAIGAGAYFAGLVFKAIWGLRRT